MKFTNIAILGASALGSNSHVIAKTATDLVVPIGDILAGNLSTHQSHALMPKLKDWLGRHEGLNKIDLASTNLKNIVCDDSSSDCMFQSVVTLDQDTIHALRSLEQGNDNTKSTNPAMRLFSRASANAWQASTHWKTYFVDGAGGAEHYTFWNVKCGTFTYTGTGFYLSDHTLEFNSNNDISTKIMAAEYESPDQVVTLQQNFACSTWGNQCCVSYYIATAANVDMYDWTWECYKGQYGPPCYG